MPNVGGTGHGSGGKAPSPAHGPGHAGDGGGVGGGDVGGEDEGDLILGSTRSSCSPRARSTCLGALQIPDADAVCVGTVVEAEAHPSSPASLGAGVQSPTHTPRPAPPPSPRPIPMPASERDPRSPAFASLWWVGRTSSGAGSRPEPIPSPPPGSRLRPPRCCTGALLHLGAMLGRGEPTAATPGWRHGRTARASRGRQRLAHRRDHPPGRSPRPGRGPCRPRPIAALEDTRADAA